MNDKKGILNSKFLQDYRYYCKRGTWFGVVIASKAIMALVARRKRGVKKERMQGSSSC